jgi:ribosomal protein L24
MYDDTNIGGLLQQGDRVKILQGVNDDLGREWYYVEVSTGDNAGNKGYVFAAYITLD